jgi:hypothetical protein
LEDFIINIDYSLDRWTTRRKYFDYSSSCPDKPEEKYFGYFVFNVVDYNYVNCG